jgi:hypothetical protein
LRVRSRSAAGRSSANSRKASMPARSRASFKSADAIAPTTRSISSWTNVSSSASCSSRFEAKCS